MILQLGKDKARLEQRCEDRKKNLKKLYFIAREKDKQLRKACNAIEHAGLLCKGMEDQMEEFQDYSNQKIERLEIRLLKVLKHLQYF